MIGLWSIEMMAWRRVVSICPASKIYGPKAARPKEGSGACRHTDWHRQHGRAEDARGILLAATYEEEQTFSLRPKSPRFLVDQRYLPFGAGLLATFAPNAVLRIKKRNLTEL